MCHRDISMACKYGRSHKTTNENVPRVNLYLYYVIITTYMHGYNGM